MTDRDPSEDDIARWLNADPAHGVRFTLTSPIYARADDDAVTAAEVRAILDQLDTRDTSIEQCAYLDDWRES